MKTILVLTAAIVLIFDVILFANPNKGMDANYIFNLAYAVIFILGTYFGFSKARRLAQSPNMRKSMVFFGIGMFFYALGLIIWTYYNIILKVEIPYPSYADWAFLLYYPGVALGTFYLVKSFGGSFTARLITEGTLTFLAFFVIIYIFLTQTSLVGNVNFWGNVLNILYPLADAFLAALAITVLRTEKGVSAHPNILYFVFGFIVLAVADTIFTYLSSNGLYWNGDISDLLFALSGFLTTWGILSIKIPSLTDHSLS